MAPPDEPVGSGGLGLGAWGPFSAMYRIRCTGRSALPRAEVMPCRVPCQGTAPPLDALGGLGGLGGGLGGGGGK